MNNVSSISSEEELLGLRDEGKITAEEYEELLGTLQRTGKVQPGPAAPAQAPPTRTSRMAVASLVLSLIGPIGSIPAVICGHVALAQIGRNAAIKGRGLALAGVIIGYTVLGFSIAVMLPFVHYVSYRFESEHAVAQRTTAIALEATELKSYPLDDLQGLITQSGVSIDKEVSSDGHGSLRIDATGPTTVRLFEAGYVHAENTRLIYQARLRTEDVEGRAYLEMWCHFPGKGEFFSKGLAAPLSGTTAWTTVETPFFLKEGENPDNVRLNLVIDGKGTVWIDNIRLLKGTLP